MGSTRTESRRLSALGAGRAAVLSLGQAAVWSLGPAAVLLGQAVVLSFSRETGFEAGLQREKHLWHRPTLSRNASLTVALCQKKKTFCAPHEPQKVLVVELVLLNPMGRMFLRGTPC
jgi:hypothetical protein